MAACTGVRGGAVMRGWWLRRQIELELFQQKLLVSVWFGVAAEDQGAARYRPSRRRAWRSLSRLSAKVKETSLLGHFDIQQTPRCSGVGARARPRP